MRTLATVSTPQLVRLHHGKVRESFRVDDSTRLIAVSDRLSAFDKVLTTPIPLKGAALNAVSAWWFERTRDVVDNHLLRLIDPNLMLVQEATPIRVEMVVRGYLAGSMWRAYQQGQRDFWGTTLPDGLGLHSPFPEPLITPTTKEASDRPITAEEIVAGGWASAGQYREMERLSRELFRRGAELLAERGLILVDTKYEFGTAGGGLILIDELHTSDSSRIWDREAYRADPAGVEALDKEFVRRWLLRAGEAGAVPDALPDDIVAETSRRYAELCRRVTGSAPAERPDDPRRRLADALVAEGLIRDGFVLIVMGSRSDLEHARAIASALEPYDVAVLMRVISAHKTPEAIPALAATLNASVEPGAVIAVAGGSNGLGGALAANLNLPVISCPPFRDRADLLLNISSSLMMPSRVPAMTVLRPAEAAAAALRSLNLPRLRERFSAEIAEMKTSLAADDDEIRQ
jgi:fusion protein PurCD